MLPKPNHLGPLHAAIFQDQSVVDAYHHRPTYPDELLRFVAGLMTDEPRAVLDVGCGTGDVARNLVQYVKRIDAVDVSTASIRKAHTLPNGDDPRIAWIVGRVEEVAFHPPYAIVTAGQSLHWMEWEIVMPRFYEMLTPRGFLAILSMADIPYPWDAEVSQLCGQFSTNRDCQPYDLFDELEQRNLFRREGETTTAQQLIRQPIENYIESIHARNGFSRDRMTREAATAFDEAVRQTVTPFAVDGQLEFFVAGSVAWGKPMSRNMHG